MQVQLRNETWPLRVGGVMLLLVAFGRQNG